MKSSPCSVSGYRHTLTILAGYCRIRSYLVSVRIHHALTGNPWLPTRNGMTSQPNS